MKRWLGILMMILVASCTRELDPACERVREGDPVMLQIGFGTDDFLHVELGTKAEANRADESRVKDLYVLLFDETGTVSTAVTSLMNMPLPSGLRCFPRTRKAGTWTTRPMWAAPIPPPTVW